MLSRILGKYFSCFHNSHTYLTCSFCACKVVGSCLQNRRIAVHVISIGCQGITATNHWSAMLAVVVSVSKRKPLASSLFMLHMFDPSVYSIKFRFWYKAELQCLSGLYFNSKPLRALRVVTFATPL